VIVMDVKRVAVLCSGGLDRGITGNGTPGAHAVVDSNYLPGRNLLLLSKAAIYCALQSIPTLGDRGVARQSVPRW